MRRRDFIRLAAAGLAGTMLSCGDDDDDDRAGDDAPPGGVLPNGFRFHAVRPAGGSLPGGGAFRRYRGDVGITGRGELVWGAVADTGVIGLYASGLDFASAPRVLGERKIVAVGDALPDGTIVDALGKHDSNDEGTIAIVLRSLTPIPGTGGGHETSGIHLHRGSALERLHGEGDITADGHRFAGLFMDVDLHVAHDVLFVASYYEGGGKADARAPKPRQGLFHTPGADPARTRLLFSTGSLTRDGSGLARRIGLVDLHDDGKYVAQASVTGVPDDVTAKTPSPPSSLSTQSARPGVIIGKIPAFGAAPSIASVPELLRPARAGGMRLLSGPSSSPSVVFGPRVGPSGRTAIVTHLTPTHQVLEHSGRTVHTTGGMSPAGNEILHFLPPSFGGRGEIYYVLGTKRGDELCGADGARRRTLLASGDRVEGATSPFDSALVGTTTEHVDRAGRLALLATFGDKSAAIAVGIPV